MTEPLPVCIRQLGQSGLLHSRRKSRWRLRVVLCKVFIVITNPGLLSQVMGNRGLLGGERKPLYVVTIESLCMDNPVVNHAGR